MKRINLRPGVVGGARRRATRAFWCVLAAALLGRDAIAMRTCEPGSAPLGSQEFARPDRATERDSPAQETLRNDSSNLLSALPVPFVENRGQWETSARYVARSDPLLVGIEPAALLACAPGLGEDGSRCVLIRLTFEGASADVALEAGDELPGKHSFFLGQDPSGWRTGVPGHADVRWRGLYPNVDGRAGVRDGRICYDLLLEPGVDASVIEISVQGASELRLEQDGTLAASTDLGELRQSPPRAWYELADGRQSDVAVRFRLITEHRFGFDVDVARPDARLVIDPGLEWSTFLGGSGLEFMANGLGVDAQGRVTFGGTTNSSDFPTTPGAGPWNGGMDGFLARIDPTGPSMALVFSVFLGGPGQDFLRDIALEPTGRVVAVGYTASSAFPITSGAVDPAYGGSSEAWAARLRETGDGLLYSTYVGGSASEQLYAVEVDASGVATAVGFTGSVDFPTTPGAFDTTKNLGDDGVVVRVAADGKSFVYSTLLGGNDLDALAAVALLPDGTAVVAGTTVSADYPTTPGAYKQTTTTWDALISKLDATGSTLLASTLLGGGPWPTGLGGSDGASSVAIGPQGRVYVAGGTDTPSFPVTPGAFKTSLAPNDFWDMFVSVLSSDLTTLLHSTFFGGSGSSPGTDAARDVAVDASGVVTIAGGSSAPDVPTTAGALSTVKKASEDGFVSRFAADLGSLIYSTFLGGGIPAPGAVVEEHASDVVVTTDGAAIVLVKANTSDYPVTSGALQPTHAGVADAAISKLDMLPTGVSKYGASTPSCLGPIAIGVTKMPVHGDASFALTSSGSPPSAVGVLAVGAGSFVAGFAILGITAHLDPSQPVFLLGATADALGWSTRALVLPPGTAGVTAYCQFVWLNTAVCGALGSFSATNALELIIQS